MADPESQMSPFRPAGIRSDEPPFTSTGKFTKQKHQESSKLLVYVLAAVVFLGTVFLMIASVFLRVNNPKLRLSSPSIQNFQYDQNSTSLNITMSAKVTVDNENFGRYVFENCDAVVLYGNSTIGGGEISGGRVGARETKSIDVAMQLRWENLNFSNGGTDTNELIEIRSYAKMTGRVHVMTIVDRRKTIEMNCTMNLNLNSRSIMHSLCR
ncbi:uncharacterized protein LOC112529718 [Cynara cardunculus var. scolymus]|uniref:uncharacterized protein LOC112529718 n=1 Tax=Cynara cardunculus var. scolymus TaxID=59895 RepID=UPI000D6309A7|nr:uncharacterized protein LOC112529718 [Cynara cardunculus var. scolymus]